MVETGFGRMLSNLKIWRFATHSAGFRLPICNGFTHAGKITIADIALGKSWVRMWSFRARLGFAMCEAAEQTGTDENKGYHSWQKSQNSPWQFWLPRSSRLVSNRQSRSRWLRWSRSRFIRASRNRRTGWAALGSLANSDKIKAAPGANRGLFC